MINFEYISHILIISKYSSYYKLLIVFILYFILSDTNYTYCMIEDTEFSEISEIKDNEVFKELKSEVLSLTDKNEQLQHEINILYSREEHYFKEIKLLREENERLKDNILQLEIITRENFTSACNCNIL